MTALTVFFDTSALPRHLERPGAAFEVLAQYVEIELVRIFVPDVCYREWSSQLVDEVQKHLQDLNRAVNAASRGPVALPAELASIITRATSALAAADTSLEKFVSNKSAALLQQLKADVMPISDSHGSAVMTGYFDGYPPFSGRKERKDIPDAFVLEALKELRAKAEGPILAVVRDKRLAEAVGTVPNVTAYSSVSELLSAEEIVAAIRETKFEAQWEAWLEMFREELPKLTEGIRAELNSQIEREMAFADLESDLIPSDNNTAIITGTAPPENLELDWGNAESVGAGWMSVPFSGSCSVLTDFDVFRSDAYSQPDWVSVQMGDPAKDHYFNAQAYFAIKATGKASVQFGRDDIVQMELGGPIQIEIDDLEFQVIEHD